MIGGGGADSCEVGLVDDDADSRLVLRAILEPEFRVVEFATGADALPTLQRRPPCVVVLDISMPGLDGFETLSLLRQTAELRAVPVLAYTGFINPEERRRYRFAGFGDLIAKPIVDIDAVLQLVRRSMTCRSRWSRAQRGLSRRGAEASL